MRHIFFSYPFSEDVSDGMSYMKTRCPSWCDRILLSHSAKDIIFQVRIAAWDGTWRFRFELENQKASSL